MYTLSSALYSQYHLTLLIVDPAEHELQDPNYGEANDPHSFCILVPKQAAHRKHVKQSAKHQNDGGPNNDPDEGEFG